MLKISIRMIIIIIIEYLIRPLNLIPPSVLLIWFRRQGRNGDRHQHVLDGEIHQRHVQLVLAGVRSVDWPTGAGHDVRRMGRLTVHAQSLVQIHGRQRHYVRAVRDQLPGLPEHESGGRLRAARYANRSVQSSDQRRRTFFIIKSSHVCCQLKISS